MKSNLGHLTRDLGKSLEGSKHPVHVVEQIGQFYLLEHRGSYACAERTSSGWLSVANGRHGMLDEVVDWMTKDMARQRMYRADATSSALEFKARTALKERAEPPPQPD